MTALRLHNFVAATDVEGPGRRAALWVQGCSIRCPGCFNPETWSEAGGDTVETSALAARILDGPEVEGVTFLGGEPFEQAVALAELAEMVRACGLSVMTFTGYRLERLLKSQLPGTEDLLATTDLLVDGPFMHNRLDHDRPWAGSTNQHFHFLTDRYRGLEDELHRIPDGLEIRFQPDGSVVVNGMADANVLKAIAAAIAEPLSSAPQAEEVQAS